jgi:hypothetical protein
MSKTDQANVQPKRTEEAVTELKPMAKPPRPVKDREISNTELKLYRMRFGQL